MTRFNPASLLDHMIDHTAGRLHPFAGAFGEMPRTWSGRSRQACHANSRPASTQSSKSRSLAGQYASSLTPNACSLFARNSNAFRPSRDCSG